MGRVLILEYSSYRNSIESMDGALQDLEHAPYGRSKVMLLTLLDTRLTYHETDVLLNTGDYGFEVRHTSEDEWVNEGFEFIGKYWP